MRPFKRKRKWSFKIFLCKEYQGVTQNLTFDLYGSNLPKASRLRIFAHACNFKIESGLCFEPALRLFDAMIRSLQRSDIFLSDACSRVCSELVINLRLDILLLRVFLSL